MDLSRAKYILPNMFTLGSVLCALFSMHIATSAASASEMALAAWLIIISAVCDVSDGRVARMTRTESEFGVQLDSLADAISFGAAPAWLMYHWGLSAWGEWGIVVAFIYLACTLMRLARFNVLVAREDHSKGPSRYFLGLPSPLAAGGVVAIVLAHISITGQMCTPVTLGVGLMSVMLGLLMVSNVKYRTFKDASLRSREGLVILALIAASITAGVVFKPSLAVVIIMALYVTMGLLGAMIHLSRSLLFSSDEDEQDELVVSSEEIG